MLRMPCLTFDRELSEKCIASPSIGSMESGSDARSPTFRPLLHDSANPQPEHQTASEDSRFTPPSIMRARDATGTLLVAQENE